MAIANYTDLVAELRDLQDDSAYSESAIGNAIVKAEAMFNRALRVPDMEKTVTLTVTSGLADLPSDCVEIRSVVWLGGAVEYPVSQTSLSDLSEAWGGVSADYPEAYAREGERLRFGPVASGSARLVYYSAIPALSSASPVNWLITAAPDLYVAGARYYLCERERDDAGAAMALREADAIMQTMMASAAKIGGGNLIPHAIHQTRGVYV